MELPQLASYLRAKVDTVRTRLATIVHSAHHKQSPLTSESEELNLLSNFESLIIELQSLLIWEKPFNSALSLLLFTFSYWLIVFWSPRFFSIIASIFFCYHFYEMWVRFLWPEIKVPTAEPEESWTSVNPKVLSAPEIQNYLTKLRHFLTQVIRTVVEFRRQSHGAFCCYSIAFFLVLFFIGKTLSGALLFYGLALIIFLAPGIILHVIPSHVQESLLSYFENTRLTSAEIPGDGGGGKESSGQVSSPSEMDGHSENESTTSSSSSTSKTNFSNQFYENFFKESDPSGRTEETEDTDDFEMISESDFNS